MRSRYMRGFAGIEAVQDWWLEQKVEWWQYSVITMSGVAGKHLQTSYTGLQKPLHQGWEFVRRVNLDIGTAFQTIEDNAAQRVLPGPL